MSVFMKKLNIAKQATGLESLVEQSTTMIADLNRSVSGALVAKAAIAMESIDSNSLDALGNAVTMLTAAVENIASGYTRVNAAGQKTSIYTKAQRDAAVSAAAMVGDIGSFLNASVDHPIIARENMAVIGTTGLGDAFGKRTLAVEAYDEKENRKAAQYTIAYNMQAARQDEFGEAFFPTITVTPDNIGFSIQAKLVSVYNDFKRNISGDLDNYKKRNIIRAAIDWTILKNELTTIVPVRRTESLNYFVANATIPAAAIDLDGESIMTAPLKMGAKFSLLAISQTDTLLANGAMDPTDSIDPAIALKNLYVQIGANKLVFKTLNLPTSVFAAPVQGNYRQMNLAFGTTSILINKNTKQIDGTALSGDLALVVSSDLIVRVKVSVSGFVNTETGDTELFANGLAVDAVYDATGTQLSLSAAPAVTFADDVLAGTVLGYDLQAYRTNLNRRQRGQLLDTTYYTQLYPVPLRSPITALRPVTTDGQTDASDLAALITATQLRASNGAVTTLLDAATILNDFVDARQASTLTVAPDVLGVGRLLVNPAFMKQSIDMTTAVDSLSSHQRATDLQAVLVNAVRDMAYRLYRDSGYQPAANALAGGIAAAPTVIIGTDPVLARYLMVDGDLRVLGAEFQCKVVSTNDLRMAGKIVVSFGQFENGAENTPNPLHFGNMAWKPEMTLVLPISRGGQTSKELTVQPSFRHVVHLPVMGIIDVTNVPNIIASKIAIFTNEQI